MSVKYVKRIKLWPRHLSNFGVQVYPWTIHFLPQMKSQNHDTVSISEQDQWAHINSSTLLLATNVMALITHMKKAALQVLIIDTPPTYIKGNKHLVGLILCTLQKPWRSNWKESHRPPSSIIAFLMKTWVLGGDCMRALC